MDEGIDEFDDLITEDGLQNVTNTPIQDSLDKQTVVEPSEDVNLIEEPSAKDSNKDDFITELLKSRGIEDSSKIKFENDNGDIEEVDWNTLDTKDKLNILQSSTATSEDGLDASEIELINAIRESELTPAEYIQHLLRTSIETYLQNAQGQGYSVDLYNDDELFVMDLISKSEDITEEEALEALERAKSNEALFKKLMGAMRNEYKLAEEGRILQLQLQLELEAQEQYNLFAELVENSILNFKEFSGCELNMSEEDMLDLYTFITGLDNAGNNWFSKALSNTDTVVLMAWFVLYGDKMIHDMNDYYLKEITNVRKESYNKGLKDAAKKDKPTVTYKPKNTKSVQTFDDLDDDF